MLSNQLIVRRKGTDKIPMQILWKMEDNKWNNDWVVLDSNDDKTVKQFYKIQQWKALKLQIHCKKGILNMIKNINFDKLKKLALFNNNIETIEVINRIKAPMLKYINLAKNNITDISTIRKIPSKYITEINIADNFVNQISGLGECNMVGYYMTRLEQIGDREQCLNIDFMAKINNDTSPDFQLLIQSSQRILTNPRTRRSLERKFYASVIIWTSQSGFWHNNDEEEEGYYDDYQIFHRYHSSKYYRESEYYNKQ